ncbi:MAG: hypothetical protein A2138_11285 [Deltaproteobacteria bacterium RBG_16_71_12]|nr:MAG: hypothetical protein A2138_11285 [Deltaproteobacteria bacterium RBG_16_71_12]
MARWRAALSMVGLTTLFGVAGACPSGDVHVPGGQDMGEECFDDEECDEPGTCLNGVCSGYPCDEGGGCKNDLACERVSDQQSCVMTCEETDDCLTRQSCVEVPRSSNDPNNTLLVCL